MHARTAGSLKPECFRRIHIELGQQSIIVMRHLLGIRSVARRYKNLRRHRQAGAFERHDLSIPADRDRGVESFSHNFLRLRSAACVDRHKSAKAFRFRP